MPIPSLDVKKVQNRFKGDKIKKNLQLQEALNGRYPVPDEVVQKYHEYTTGEYPEFPGAESTYICSSEEGYGHQRLWKILREGESRSCMKRPGLS